MKKAVKTGTHFFTDLLATLSDEALMQELQLGNFKAAARLFERWKGGLFNFFLRQTGERALAEDLTQSAFERMIKYRSTYKPAMAFRAWIFQIARNLLYSNQQKVQNQTKAFAAMPLTREEEGPRIDRQLEREEDRAKLWRAMDRLPADYREVLLLTKIQKIPYREVGQILNCTEGAVKVKVHRAIAKLKVIFSDLSD